MTLPQLGGIGVSLGADPEFFFRNAAGRIIGAEHIIPKEGLKFHPNQSPVIVIDGVQAEMHPSPTSCREGFAGNIYSIVSLLVGALKQHKGVTASLDVSTSITKTELDKMADANKVFGCGASINAYDKSVSKLSMTNPLIHMQRSAGGHMHFGLGEAEKKRLVKNPDAVVAMLDIICGNTLVLVDRDRGNIARRKLYGMAGEYRLPKHGLEYRVPSNFWLKHYTLMSLAFGLGRLALDLALDYRNGDAYIKAFSEAVDIEKVRKAINANNYKMALTNFKAIVPLIKEATQDAYNYGRWPINAAVMDEFMFFLDVIKDDEFHWFDDETFIEHWTLTYGKKSLYGFNDFLTYVVRGEMLKAGKTTKQPRTTDDDDEDDDD